MKYKKLNDKEKLDLYYRFKFNPKSFTIKDFQVLINNMGWEELDVSFINFAIEKKVYKMVEPLLKYSLWLVAKREKFDRDFHLEEIQQAMIYLWKWYEYIFPKVRLVKASATIKPEDIKEIISIVISELASGTNNYNPMRNSKASSFLIVALKNQTNYYLKNHYYIDFSKIVYESDIGGSLEKIEEDMFELDQFVSQEAELERQFMLDRSFYEFNGEESVINYYCMIRIARRIFFIIEDLYGIYYELSSEDLEKIKDYYENSFDSLINVIKNNHRKYYQNLRNSYIMFLLYLLPSYDLEKIVEIIRKQHKSYVRFSAALTRAGKEIWNRYLRMMKSTDVKIKKRASDIRRNLMEAFEDIESFELQELDDSFEDE